ncbi:MAG TPA: hypothetical protein VM144_02020 [Aestuariivirga sp.]|nr:hypothetical protein [Aestuariivirga sp.]
MQEREAALGEDDTKRCTLGREEVLGYAKGLRILTEFLNCSEIDGKEKAVILGLLEQAPLLEEEVAQVCKQAGM